MIPAGSLEAEVLECLGSFLMLNNLIRSVTAPAAPGEINPPHVTGERGWMEWVCLLAARPQPSGLWVLLLLAVSSQPPSSLLQLFSCSAYLLPPFSCRIPGFSGPPFPYSFCFPFLSSALSASPSDMSPPPFFPLFSPPSLSISFLSVSISLSLFLVPSLALPLLSFFLIYFI